MLMVLCILLISHGGNELAFHKTLYQWFWRRKRRLFLLPLILWYPYCLIVSLIPLQPYRPYCGSLFDYPSGVQYFSPTLTDQYRVKLKIFLEFYTIIYREKEKVIYVPSSILWVQDYEWDYIMVNSVYAADTDAVNSPKNSKIKELAAIYRYHQWHNPDSTSEDVSNSWCQLVEAVTTQPDAYLETP